MTDTKTTKQTLLPPLPDPRSLNSRRHGILSEQIPAWERDSYTAHLNGVRDSVNAKNYLEQRLADRAALALWRLDRVAAWEAAEMEAEQRRFIDRVLSADTMPDFAASFGGQSPIDARGLRETLAVLAKLTGEQQGTLLRDPETIEQIAADYDLEAEAWRVVLASGDVTTIADVQLETLGVELIMELLDPWNVPAERVARVLVERKPTKDEVETVTDWNWIVTAQELVRLLDEAKKAIGADALRSWVLQKYYAASGKAGQLRVVGARLPVLFAQELARAVEPDVKRLEKVARYEAHLERVLYRSLNELRVVQEHTTDQLPQLSASDDGVNILN